MFSGTTLYSDFCHAKQTSFDPRHREDLSGHCRPFHQGPSGNILYKTTKFPKQGVTSFMRLDKAAFTALHIMPADMENNRAPTSLLGLLNKCRSAAGTRKLTAWLRQPLVNPEEITRRQDVVECFVKSQDLLTRMQSSLRSRFSFPLLC